MAREEELTEGELAAGRVASGEPVPVLLRQSVAVPLEEGRAEAEATAVEEAQPLAAAVPEMVISADGEGDGAPLMLPLLLAQGEAEDAPVLVPPKPPLGVPAAVPEALLAPVSEARAVPLALPLVQPEAEAPPDEEPAAVPVPLEHSDSVTVADAQAGAVDDAQKVALAEVEALPEAVPSAPLRLGAALLEGERLDDAEAALLRVTEGLAVGASAVPVLSTEGLAATRVWETAKLRETAPERVGAALVEAQDVPEAAAVAGLEAEGVGEVRAVMELRMEMLGDMDVLTEPVGALLLLGDREMLPEGEGVSARVGGCENTAL